MDLTWKKPVAWEKYSDDDRTAVFALGEKYRAFLSGAKTERLSVDAILKEALAAGFCDIRTAKTPLQPGQKYFWNQSGKALALFTIGQKPLIDGLRIVGAHVDNPRLDLKPAPLYEDHGLAFFDTHYYGGIKKYQWTAVPLALHGVVARKDGTTVTVSIGDDPNEPVLGVTDLLIHLAREQMEKPLSKGITGEGLDALVATMPVAKEIDENGKEVESKDPVKQWVLKWLNEKYQITEEDFASADLSLVPAGPARDFGLDRSLVMGYGHDDRICSWVSWEAMKQAQNPTHTTVALLTDKEEIGSVGATGADSHFFEDAVAELLALEGDYNDLKLRRCMRVSKALSGDVTNGYDPLYADVSEPRNAAYMGKGICLEKYVGSGGKGGSNDASAEYMAWLRNLMEQNGVSWQAPELGKVDAGGGGTIAYALAAYGMDVVDCGIPLFNMHAPWELASKADLYEMCKGFAAFYRS